MKLKLLNQKYQAYSACLTDDYDAAYEGGKKFDHRKNRFLEQHPFEPHEIYCSRVKSAEYQNFAGPIIDQFAAQLFSANLKIIPNQEDIHPYYVEFQKDVDRSGTDLVNFLQQSFVNTVTKGKTWISLELPISDEINSLKLSNQLSKTKQEELGFSDLSICRVDNNNVYDYDIDAYGNLNWIKIYKQEFKNSDPFAPRDNITETWKIYDKQFIYTFSYTHSLDERYDEDKDIPLTSKIAHNFNTRVPYLCMEFPVGLWIMNRIYSAQIGHFRTSAQLDWSMLNSSYPIPVINSDNADTAGQGVSLGVGRVLYLGENDKIAYFSPPADAFNSMKDRIEAKRIEIYRVTQMMASGISNSAVIGRSADSKSMDMSATEICLQAYGRYVKELVSDIYKVLTEVRGDDIEFSIEGLSSFNSESLQSIIADFTASKNLMLSNSKSFLKNMEQKIASLSFADLDSIELDKINKEISEFYDNESLELLDNNEEDSNIKTSSSITEDAQ